MPVRSFKHLFSIRTLIALDFLTVDTREPKTFSKSMQIGGRHLCVSCVLLALKGVNLLYLAITIQFTYDLCII